MLAGSLPISFQVIGWLIAVIVGIGAVVGGYYLVKGRKVSADVTLADSAINSLTASNVALSSRLDLVEQENKHCMELKKQQDVVITAQDKRISDLREDVSQRAAVAEFRDETRGLLTAIVDKLGIPITDHPPVKAPA